MKPQIAQMDADEERSLLLICVHLRNLRFLSCPCSSLLSVFSVPSVSLWRTPRDLSYHAMSG
jgi:hypothetical protein